MDLHFTNRGVSGILRGFNWWIEGMPLRVTSGHSISCQYHPAPSRRYPLC